MQLVQLRWGHTRVGPIWPNMTDGNIKEEGDTERRWSCEDTEMQRDNHMKMETKPWMLHLLAKEWWRLPAVTRSQEKGMEQILPQSPWKEPTPSTSWFQTSSLRTVREQISVVLIHPVRGSLLWHPQEMDTVGVGRTGVTNTPKTWSGSNTTQVYGNHPGPCSILMDSSPVHRHLGTQADRSSTKWFLRLPLSSPFLPVGTGKGHESFDGSNRNGHIIPSPIPLGRTSHVALCSYNGEDRKYSATGGQLVIRSQWLNSAYFKNRLNAYFQEG